MHMVNDATLSRTTHLCVLPTCRISTQADATVVPELFAQMHPHVYYGYEVRSHGRIPSPMLATRFSPVSSASNSLTLFSWSTAHS